MGRDIKDLQETEKERSRKSNDYLINTVLAGKSGMDLLDEGYLPEDFSMQPREAYQGNEKLQEFLEGKGITRDGFSKLYDKALEGYNDFESESKEDVRAMFAREFRGGQKLDKRVREAPDYDSILSPMEQATTLGYVDEGGSRARLENSWRYMLGKDGNYRIKGQDIGNGETGATKNKYGYYELERIDAHGPPEYDDVMVSAFNLGRLGNSFLNADRVNESAASYVSRTVLKAIPYFIPYVNYGMAAIDLAKGGGHLVRSFARAAGAGAENLDRFNNYWRRTEIGMGVTHSPFSVQSIVENVGDVVTQVLGMKAAFKGVSKLAGTMGTSAGTAKFSGQLAGRLVMSLPASQDIALLAEHYGIDPKHTAFMHAIVTAGYMSLGGLAEKFFMPAEVNTILRHSTREAMRGFGPQLSSRFSFNLGKNAAQTMVHNGRVLLQKMSKLKDSSPRLYQVLLGSMYEGIEEVSETVMEETVKNAYNAWQPDKEYKKGRFNQFSTRDFLRKAGVSFFYGAIAGGLMGSRLGKKMLGMESGDTVKTMMHLAQNQEMRTRMDALVEKEGHRVFGSDKLTYNTDGNGNYTVPDYDSTDIIESTSQNKMNQSILRAQWEYTKAIVDAGLLGRGSDMWTPAVEKVYEKFVEDQKGILSEKAAQVFTELEQLKKEKSEVKEAVSVEEDDEAYKTKLADVESRIKEKQAELEFIYSRENVDNLTNGALYHFAPGINVDNNGKKISMEEPGYLTFERFQELNRHYNEKINAIRERIANARKVEDKLRATENIEEAIGAANSSETTREGLEHIEGLFNVSDSNIRETYTREARRTAQEQYGEEGALELEGEGLLDIDAIGAIDISGFSNALSGSTTIQELLEQQRILHEQQKSYNPSPPVDVNEREALIGPLLQDPDGQDISVQLEEETAAQESAPNEYVSQKPEAIIDELGKHKQYTHAMAGNLVMLNSFRQLNGQEYLAPEELKDELENYQGVLGRLSILEDRAVTLAGHSLKNRNNAVEAINTKSKEVLDLRAELLNETVSEFFADPRFDNLRTEIQAELVGLAEEDVLFEDARERMYKVEKSIYDAFDQLSEKEKKETLHFGTYRGAETSQRSQFKRPVKRLALLRGITGSGPADFAKYFASVTSEMESVPTYEQEIAIREVFSNFNSNYRYNGKVSPFVEVLEEAVKANKIYSPHLVNAFFVQGAAGAGKTSYITGVAINMWDRFSKEQGLGKTIYNKAIPAGPQVTQQENLGRNLKEKGILLATDKGIDAGILLEDLRDGQNMEYLDTAGIIVFDEATWIPRETLQSINGALRDYNKIARKPGEQPLQILYVGDPDQLGNFNISEDGATGDNISEVANKFETTYVNMSMRSKNEPLNDINKNHILRRINSRNKTIIQNEPLEVKWGHDAQGRLAGARIIRGENLQGELKEVLAMIKLQPGTTFAYITDKPIEQIPESAREYAVPVEKIQGQEFDAVIVDFSENVMLHTGTVNAEKISLKMLGVAIGRAREFAAITNRGNREWSSVNTKEQVREVFSLLNEETIKQVAPQRKAQIKSVAESLQPLKEDSPLDVSKFKVKSVVSVEELQEHVGEVFENWFREQYRDTIQMEEEALEEGINELDTESEVYGKEKAKLTREAQNSMVRLIKEAQVVFDNEVSQAWDKILEQVKEINQEDKTVPPEERTTGEGILSEAEYHARKILESIDDSSVIKQIPEIEPIIASKISPPGEVESDTHQEAQELENKQQEEKEKSVEDEKEKPISETVGVKLKIRDGLFLDLVVLEDNSVLYKNTYKPVENERVKKLALLESGKVPYDKVKASNGHTYAVTKGKGTIIDIHMAPDGTPVNASRGKVIMPDSPIGKEILEKNGQSTGIEESMKKVENNVKAEGEYVNSIFNSGELPMFTWLTHDFGGGRTGKEIYNIKRDIFSDKSKNLYRYTLRTGSITELSDTDADIIYPGALQALSGGKVAYIEASWGDNNRIVLGVLPYVSQERLARNPKFHDINTLIEDGSFNGLDVTELVNRYLLNPMNRRMGRVQTSEREIGLDELIRAHKDNTNNPDVSFSSGIYSFTANPVTGKKIAGKPFLFYSSRPKAELDRLVQGFINNPDVGLEFLEREGVGVIMLNNKVFESFSGMGRSFNELAGKGYTVRGKNLLSEKSARAIVEHLVKIFPKSSPEQKKVIKSVLNNMEIVHYNEPVEIKSGMLGIEFRVNGEPVKLNKPKIAVDVMGVHAILEKSGKDLSDWFDSEIDKAEISPGKKAFPNGIMLSSKFSKRRLQGSSVGSIEPAISSPEGSGEILIDDNIMGLYTTGVARISTPDVALSQEFLNGLITLKEEHNKYNQQEIQLEEDKNMEDKEYKKIAHKAIALTTEVLADKSMSKPEIDEIIEEINEMGLSKGHRDKLLEMLNEAREKAPETPRKVRTKPRVMNHIERYLDENIEHVVGEDKPKTITKINELLDEFSKLEPTDFKSMDKIEAEIKNLYKGDIEALFDLLLDFPIC